MSEANKHLVRRWFEEVWNKGQESTIDELLAPNGVGHGLGEGEAELHGPAELKQFVRNMRGSFPDVHISVEDLIAEGDRVMARVLVSGTHTGAGVVGAPATGRPVKIAGIMLVRISG